MQEFDRRESDAAIGRLTNNIKDFEKHLKEASAVIQSFGLGHALAYAALVNLLVNAGVITRAQIEGALNFQLQQAPDNEQLLEVRRAVLHLLQLVGEKPGAPN